MTDSLGPAKLFATLLAMWLLLNGSLALDVLGVGVLAAGAITLLFRDSLSVLSGARFTPASIAAAFGFVGYFLVELVKANLQMARIVLDPARPISPAIVRTETKLTHPVARLLLANAITLTPGTLSVEIKGSSLYIHWVTAKSTNTEKATREIVAGFERYLEVIYD